MGSTPVNQLPDFACFLCRLLQVSPQSQQYVPQAVIPSLDHRLFPEALHLSEGRHTGEHRRLVMVCDVGSALAMLASLLGVMAQCRQPLMIWIACSSSSLAG